MTDTAGRTNHTLEKGLDILGLFDDDRPALTAHEMRQELGLSLSTLYRLLRSMKAKGWIEDDAAGRFRPGFRILTLARVVRRQIDAVRLALPVMCELSRETGETVLLTVISGTQAVCIERVEGPGVVRATLERGAVLPLHAGASATVLLAFSDEELQESILSGPLDRYTENTICDPALLRRTLDRIRADGYAFSDHEVDAGVRAVGAPIRARSGALVAGLSLVAPTGRLPDAQIPRIAALVKHHAALLSDLAELTQ